MEDGDGGPSEAGRQRKEKCLWMLCNLPDCLQMWLEMEAEGEGLVGRPVLPPSRHISCLFSKWGKDVQTNRRRGRDSVSCWRSRSGRQPGPLRGAWRLFSAMAAPLACLGQPTYVARSRKRVKSISFSLSLLFPKHFHPRPEDCALVAAHPRVLTLCVWNYFSTGSCV